jgi:hypothetical protein
MPRKYVKRLTADAPPRRVTKANRKRKVVTRRDSSRGKWLDFTSEELAIRKEQLRKRREELGITARSYTDRRYFSRIEKRDVRIKDGCYPKLEVLNGKPYILMKSAPRIRTEDQLPDGTRNVIKHTLDAMLRDVEITLQKPDLNPDGTLKTYVVSGLACVDYIMQVTVGKHKEFAKIMELRDFVTNPVYQDLYPQFKTVDGWRAPTLEELCDACKISPGHFIGIFFEAVRQFGQQKAKLKIDLALSDVVGASLESAVNGGQKGFKDRQMLLDAAAIIQKSPGVNVQVNTQVNNGAAPGAAQGLPVWEDVKQVAQRGDRKMLNPISVDGEIVEAEVIRDHV